MQPGEPRTRGPDIPVEQFLTNLPLFSDLTPEEIQRIAGGTRRIRDQIVKVLICIICSNAQENEKPGANSAYFSAGNAHRRLFYPLYNCTHCCPFW